MTINRTVEIDEPIGGTFTHRDDCPEGSPDRVLWVCDQGHWLATEIPPGVGDQCPVIWHQADSDGRCIGTLSRPECRCKEGGALLCPVCYGPDRPDVMGPEGHFTYCKLAAALAAAEGKGQPCPDCRGTNDPDDHEADCSIYDKEKAQ